MKFRDRVIRFMNGRYGIDTMWYVLLTLYVILTLLELVVPRGLAIGLRSLSTVVLVTAIYRALSRNIARRRRENEFVLKLFRPIRLWFRRLRDFRTHVYRRCPYCGKTLRFPRKKGEHTANCPVCHQPFKVKIRF